MRNILLLALMCTNILNAADWFTNYDQALSKAQTTNKPILVDFTGSDWCPWCMKLKSEVFSKPEFQSWAKDNVILLEIDFPRNIPQDDATKAANAALAQKFNIQGYPTVVILNPDGSEKARTGYRRGGAGPYVKYLEGLIK